MDIIPIQGTSVPSEHIFSSAGETNTDCRSCLSAEMMQALQVLKFGIKSKGVLSFSRGMTWSEELEYLEMLTDDVFAVPTDMRAYVERLRAFRTFVTH